MVFPHVFSFHNQGVTIDSLKGTKRDWEGLARKIRKGIPLRDAVVACGIPEGEALEYISKANLKPSEISFELKLLAEKMIKVGMTKLIQIAEEGPRINDEVSSYSNTDLAAAQSLAKMGIDLIKLSSVHNPEVAPKGKLATLGVQLDLWDSNGAWELKKPGSD